MNNGLATLIFSIHLSQQCQSSPSQRKIVLVNFIEALGLLAMARLAMAHSVLVFQNVDMPVAYADITTIIRRLGTIGGFPVAKHHLSRMVALEKLRQRLVHMDVVITPEQLAIVIADSFPIAEAMLEQEPERGRVALGEGGSVWAALHSLRLVAHAARERADQGITPVLRAARNGSPWPLRCPVCLEEYMVTRDGDQGHCLYCLHQSSLRECVKCGQLFPEEDLGPITGRCSACDQGRIPNPTETS